MKKEYQTKRKLFNDTVLILSHQNEVGFIKRISWLGDLEIGLHNQKFSLKRKHFFSPVMEIYDSNNILKGFVKRSNWGVKVFMEFENKSYTYKPINGWQNIWGLFHKDTKVSSFKRGIWANGSLRTYTQDISLILLSICIADCINVQVVAG